jgi:ATP-dependent Clp protease ATP-binding subunit ClpA
VSKGQTLGFAPENDDESAYERMKAKVQQELKQHFRPEFVNRLDEVIVFHPLDRNDLTRIIDIQLARLLQRLEERRLTVELTPAAREQLVDEGHDPVYGARPLKRTIQRRVLDPLAMKVLQGEFREGDHVVIDAGSPDLTFAKGAAPRVH